MSSRCIYSTAATLGCVDAQGPVRATYRNLYKWPESDAEFVKSVTRGGGGSAGACCEKLKRGPRRRRQYQQPRVVDSYSCRQMYLRSYTFSKKESVPERTKKCLGRVKDRVAAVGKEVIPGCVPLWVNGGGGAGKVDGAEDVGMAGAGSGSGGQRRKKRSRAAGVGCRLQDASAAAFCSIFHRLLSCTASVEVVDR